MKTRPMSAMNAPTISSLRSGESASHQVGEAGTGAGRYADFPFAGGVFCPPLPCEGANVFPLGFALDLDDEEGVLSGIIKV